jgi:hypothetical protein
MGVDIKMDHEEGCDLDPVNSGQDQVTACCENGDKICGLINRRKFSGQLCDFYFLKMSSPHEFGSLIF